jgi:hypothetical protein
MPSPTPLVWPTLAELETVADSLGGEDGPMEQMSWLGMSRKAERRRFQRLPEVGGDGIEPPTPCV